MTLVPMLCIIILCVVLVIIFFLYRNTKNKYFFGHGRNVMTFSNPNYYTTSNNEPPAVPTTSNIDKKSFLWKRLKYDKSQVSTNYFRRIFLLNQKN